ncbi:MAG: hypothetical protein CFH21_00542 [Alphaproteobacteria bacterium MarineAlpha5_Bin11]|nr:MAG: hypothetical protein CFH21_00542 [Alphaproteobacteria bacterium MarineAlpha5_Bin11]PPR51987.1 MAG: hypothetical protein CFH20_00175 [Alphaproteobacteria bacterium MarineAlpha5_Bin10]|tara:strand:+ start:430 stop:597 length:168 start_codon:yes stop_codon:yes gene_type:complete
MKIIFTNIFNIFFILILLSCSAESNKKLKTNNNVDGKISEVNIDASTGVGIKISQ